MSMTYGRASRIASSCPKEFDFQYFIYQNEGNYPMWTTWDRIFGWLYSLPEDIVWNSLICVLVLFQVVITSMNVYDLEIEFMYLDIADWADIACNSCYALNLFSHIYYDCYRIKHRELEFKARDLIKHLIDALTFLHFIDVFFQDDLKVYIINVSCYIVRLWRPIQFLKSLMAHNLRGDVFGMLLKYMYIFVLIRVLYVNFFLWINLLPKNVQYNDYPPAWMQKSNWSRIFFKGFYVVDKLFLGFGPDLAPVEVIQRLSSISLMISGSLFVRGITVANMALIVGIFIRPEEKFRARFRIITNDMITTRTPEHLRQKVETFYRMYWHKQKAVSKTHLMPLFPPTLKHAINTDIYFEAQQKSRILCDLSYQFLAEIAKFMQTIHYVPGDTVIQRKSTKSTMVYISYGDVEMLTAEDDDTPILRFTRGSIMNPCGGCAEVASAVSHVSIRAATFCTAHVLEARDLWHVTAKFGKTNGQAFILHSAFEEHFEKVKRHYTTRIQPPTTQHKSTIMMLKRNLMELKQARDSEGKYLLSRNDMFLEIAGCYVMRNQENTSLRDDSDPICLRTSFPCILQPNSSLLVCWNLLVAALTVVVVFVHPYNIIYLKTRTKSFKQFDHFMTLIYILDIYATLSTGTKIEEGIPVTLRHTAPRQFSSLWFLVDLVAIFPVLYFVGDGRFAGFNKIIKILKVFRLLKSLENVFLSSSNYLRFTSFVLVMLCMTFLLGCVFQYVNCFPGFSNRVGAKCDVKNISFPPFHARVGLNDGPTEMRLLFTWFWGVCLFTFTTHKSAAAIVNAFEAQFLLMIFLEICAIVSIMLEAVFSATMMSTSQLRDQYNTCIDTVTLFLKKSSVDPVLRHRFTDYLKLCWFTDKAYSITHNKNSILFDLPPHVYQEIMAMQRNKYLLCIPCITTINKELLKTLCSYSRAFYTSPNEILQNTGEMINEIYVISQGMCELINPITQKVSRIISAKHYFGDVECLLRLPAFYTVRAVTHVQMIYVSRKHVVKAINSPRIMDAIRYARQQPEFMQLQTRRCTFLKYEMAPPPPNREFFPLPRKHEPDTAFQLPFTRLGFFAILRYIFPRFAIRPDGRYMTRYEWFRCACAILSSLLFPHLTSLRLQWPNVTYIAQFLDITAYLDIVQRMLVAYYDEKGILVYHPVSTAAHYIKGAFLLDLISCLPLETLDSIRSIVYVSDNHPGTFWQPRTVQYLMFWRLGQLYRVPNSLDILSDYIERQDIIFLIKTLPIFIAFLSVLTAFLVQNSVKFYVAQDGSGRYYLEAKRPPQSWIDLYPDFVDYNVIETPWNLVLTCFYWITYEVTTEGYDVLQSSNMTMLYAIFCGIFVGSILTTYIAVTVLSIRANVNYALASYQGHIQDIQTFMKREKVDEELQKEVLSYYEYKWEKTAGIDYRTMLKLCDQITLRTDTILHIYGQTFSKCPLLYKADMSLLRILGRAVYSRYYRQHMMLVDREEVISDLYLIDYGTVEMRHPRDDNHIITKLPRGSLFGNLDNVKNTVCPNRFVASSNLHLMRIDAVMFYKIIADFPSVKVLLMKFRPNEENFIIGSLRDQSVVATTWRERAMSSPLIEISKEGFLQFLNVQSKGIQIYFIIVSLLSVYGEVYNAGFHNNQMICIAILYFLDACFFVKIILNCAMPYISDEESESRMALVSSRKSYLKGEFKYDALSILPIELLSYTRSDPWSVYAFLRLNRVMRIPTIYNGLQRYHQKLSINLTITTIASVFIWFTVFIHTSTCVWYLMSIFEEDHVPYSSWRYTNTCRPVRPKRQKPKICTMKSHCSATRAMVSNQLEDYVCALYFVVSAFTLNGVSDILPRQQLEVVFVCILMICSTLLMMIYVGEFSNIIQYQSFRCFNFYSKYLELQGFLAANRLSRNLVEMTKLYTLYLWRESRGYQAPHFLDTAPQCLKLRVMSATYMKHLRAHPTFEYCEPAFLRHLVGFLKPFLYVENMWVVKDAEITNAMYFVHRGRVLELDEEMEREMMVYHPGMFFGTPHGLVRDLPYALSYKTVIKSQILTLTYDDWEYLLEHFPKSRDIIYKSSKGDDDDKDKKKKKLQITKAPTVRTIARKSEIGDGSKIRILDSDDAPMGLDATAEQIDPFYETETTQLSPMPRKRKSSEEERKGDNDADLGKYPSIKSHFSKSTERLAFDQDAKHTAKGPESIRVSETFDPKLVRRLKSIPSIAELMAGSAIDLTTGTQLAQKILKHRDELLSEPSPQKGISIPEPVTLPPPVTDQEEIKDDEDHITKPFQKSGLPEQGTSISAPGILSPLTDQKITPVFDLSDAQKSNEDEERMVKPFQESSKPEQSASISVSGKPSSPADQKITPMANEGDVVKTNEGKERMMEPLQESGLPEQGTTVSASVQLPLLTDQKNSPMSNLGDILKMDEVKERMTTPIQEFGFPKQSSSISEPVTSPLITDQKISPTETLTDTARIDEDEERKIKPFQEPGLPEQGTSILGSVKSPLFTDQEVTPVVNLTDTGKPDEDEKFANLPPSFKPEIAATKATEEGKIKLEPSSESEEEEPPKPSYGRRKSTFHNVDTEKTKRELDEIKLSTEIPLVDLAIKNLADIDTTPLDKKQTPSVEEIELQKISYSLDTIKSKQESSQQSLKSEIPIEKTEQIESVLKPMADQSEENEDILKLNREDRQNRDLMEKLEIAPEVKKNLEPELFLDMPTIEPKEKRSMLAFKDEITTVEIPFDKSFSDGNKTDPLDVIRQSMTSFIDDIAMKEKGPAADDLKTVLPTSASGVHYAKSTEVFDIDDFIKQEQSRNQDASNLSLASSAASLAGTSKSAVFSTMDVEDFMFKDKEKKAAKKRSSRESRSSKKNEEEQGKRSGRKQKEEGVDSTEEEAGPSGLAGKRRRPRRRKWPWC